jgi:hypothetical protein
MSRYDSPDIGKADTGSFKFVLTMEAVEDPKESVDISHIETNTVVPDKKYKFIPVLFAADPDFSPWPSAREFNCVGEEVVTHQFQQRWIAPY